MYSTGCIGIQTGTDEHVLRVGIDVGGTFTDLMLVDDDTGSVTVHKVPSTPADPSVATMQGLRELCELGGATPAGVDQLLHGTTVATNIVLERKGSRTGMITTKGFRDIIYIGRHRRPKTFSIYQDLPWREPTLVPRRHRLVVDERIVPPGDVVVPLDDDEVRACAARLRDAGVEAVAVCLLFSFLNPEHERRIKAILEEELPGVHLSISHEVVPQHREYERFSTTALNAYIGPKTSEYLRRMHGALRDLAPDTDFHLMASNGGTLTVDGAVSRPAQLLMSGPVAGIVGGIAAGRSAGYESVITLDVGGTSADIGVAPDAIVRMKHLYDTNLGGYEVMVPMVDLDTIGAGGGSLARVDAGGLLRVGPSSAGAVPGPACYGRGGTEPAATDAQAVLGRMRPDARLAGGLELDVEAARAAIGRLGDKLGLDLTETAVGITQILTQNMVNAISVNSVQKGFDPRDFSLVAFGGGGPLYGADIARELSIPRVIVPPHPGITSAMGLLDSDLKYESQRTVMVEAPEADAVALEAVFAELEAGGRAALDADEVADADRLFQRWADCRYVGQAYELLVPVPPGPLDEAGVLALAEAFEQTHEREYFYRFPEKAVQIVHLRSYAIGLMPSVTLRPIEAGDAEPPADAVVETRPVVFAQGDDRTPGELATPFYARDRLRAGNVLTGPAIVEQLDSTTVIPPGTTARVLPDGAIVIDVTTEAGA
ncbi:hydantoinase/oxoprolinase family protein [Baekduia soli]|nr:hydantoinase/oxoprolinase family protein [Baekduia soli]